jgi:hypothetical protein
VGVNAWNGDPPTTASAHAAFEHLVEEGEKSSQALKPPQPVRLQHTVAMNNHAADREKSGAIVKKVY